MLHSNDSGIADQFDGSGSVSQNGGSSDGSSSDTGNRIETIVSVGRHDYSVESEGNVAGSNTKWAVEQPINFSGRPIIRTNDRGNIQPPLSVTCGQYSCGMVLNTQGNPVAVSDIIAQRPPDLKNEGSFLFTLKRILLDHGVESKVHSSNVTVSDLKSWTSNGNPAIAMVRVSDEALHYVVVDGVTKRHGIDVVAIRDPAGKINGGVYYETVDSFNNRFSKKAVMIK